MRSQKRSAAKPGHEGARTPLRDLREIAENLAHETEADLLFHGPRKHASECLKCDLEEICRRLAEGPGEAERLLHVPLAPNRLAEIECRVRKCDSPDATNIWFAYTKELLAALVGAQVPPATPAPANFDKWYAGYCDRAKELCQPAVPKEQMWIAWEGHRIAAAPQPQEDMWRHQFRDAIAEQSYLRWREKFLTTSSGGLGYDLGPWCDLKPETKDGWRKQADKFMPSIDALLDAVRKKTVQTDVGRLRCWREGTGASAEAVLGNPNIDPFAKPLAEEWLSARKETIERCEVAFKDEYSKHDSPLIGVMRGLEAIRALATAPTGEEK